jgi:predicted RNA-binding Zn ribbon-like protein
MAVSDTAGGDEPLAIALLNTLQIVDGSGHDHLADDAAAADWLRRMGPRLDELTGAHVDASEIAAIAPRLRRVRDAARQLAAAAVTDPRPTYTPTVGDRADAVAALNGEAATWVQLAWPEGAGPRPTLAHRGDAGDLVLAALARDVITVLTGPEDRLKPCLAPGCSYFFWKQRRQEWCSPECGNRARAARHYQRHHGAGRRSAPVPPVGHAR